MVCGGEAGPPHSVWDRASSHYNRQLWLERAAIDQGLELLDPPAQARVLDLGTGTGAVLRRLARSRRSLDVIGVDPSAGMLSRVRDLPDRWSVEVADARCLPFPDAHFDAVIASYVIHVIAAADLPLVTSELRRVMRPAARLVTVTPAVPGRAPARWLAVAFDRLAGRHPSRFGGLRAFDPRLALETAGFEIREARWSLRGYPSLSLLARAPASPGDRSG